MPPRHKNKTKSTAVANAAPMPKYPNKKYSKEEKEAVYTEFHDMKNNVDVYSFIVKETTYTSREKIFGKQGQSVKNAMELVISTENSRRRTKNLTPIITLPFTGSELEEEMCRLPNPQPPGISNADFVLSHLEELRKTKHREFAEHVKEMIFSYYNPVENTLFVPYPQNRTTTQQLAATFRTFWSRVDQSNKSASTKGVLNWWKKGILQHLGFVDDNRKHSQLVHVDKLREFKELHGHCFPPQRGEYNNLHQFLHGLRRDGTKYEDLDPEVKRGLEDIGFDPHATRSAEMAAAHDQKMIVKLESFHKQHRDTWVPYPVRTQDTTLHELYWWTVDIRFRINHSEEEDVIPLAEDIQRRLVAIGFVEDPMSHHGVYRMELRHYELVQQAFDEMGFEKKWNANDKTHTNDKRKRRPDRVLYEHNMQKNSGRVIISEFDEAAHSDRSKESEQRKVYQQCVYFLHDKEEKEEENVEDIHIIRVDGGHNPMSNKEQARKHAEMIKEIMNSSYPDKPTITVHMLDFERDHHHVKAYQARIVPPKSNAIVRATEEDEWNSKPMYDAVLLYRTERGGLEL